MVFLSMKAFYLTKNGDAHSAFELRDLHLPDPAENEVLLKTESFGLNYADVMARLGLYRECPPIPTVIGYEAVGRVEKIGSQVKKVKVGDRVLAFTRFGGYASHVLTPELAVIPVDNRIPSGIALALAVQYSTAWYALEECMNLHAGDRVLIHAAAGGVGTALIQMAKRRRCIIAGTAGSAKLDYLSKQGVDLPIDYRNKDFEKELIKEGWGGKLDAIFDPVGGISVRKGMNLLGGGGKMLVFGGSSMTDAGNIFQKLKVAAGFGIWSPIVLMKRSISIIGVNMLRIAENKPELLQLCMSTVMDLYKKGELEPVVGKEYPAKELAEAHDFLESRNSVGKIVVHWNIS
jgi:NADPH:quinone reductase-like Zn-dependent oxidoreductase